MASCWIPENPVGFAVVGCVVKRVEGSATVLVTGFFVFDDVVVLISSSSSFLSISEVISSSDESGEDLSPFITKKSNTPQRAIMITVSTISTITIPLLPFFSGGGDGG